MFKKIFSVGQITKMSIWIFMCVLMTGCSKTSNEPIGNAKKVDLPNQENLVEKERRAREWKQKEMARLEQEKQEEQHKELARIEEEKLAKEKKRAALFKQSKQELLSRPADVMNACWGDPVEVVRLVFGGKFEKIVADEDGLLNSGELRGTVVIDNQEMDIIYIFYNNELVKCSLMKYGFGDGGVARSCYSALLIILYNKYGDFKITELRNSKFVNWSMPKNKIQLYYSPGPQGMVSLHYTANSSEFVEYEKLKTQAKNNANNKNLDSLKKGF